MWNSGYNESKEKNLCQQPSGSKGPLQDRRRHSLLHLAQSFITHCQNKQRISIDGPLRTPRLKRTSQPIDPATIIVQQLTSSFLQDKSGLEEDSCSISKALNTPEILEMILSHLDDVIMSSGEPVHGKKKLHSLRQARLLCQSESQALTAWKESQKTSSSGGVFSCLLASRNFHYTAKRVLSRRINVSKINDFLQYASSPAASDNLCRALVLHKLKEATQSNLDAICQNRLERLELYVCPNLVPNDALLGQGTLQKLALPGCSLVDDEFLNRVASRCPKLQILDLRACELISDVGIMSIALGCPSLQYLNVGRVNKGWKVTDSSIIEVTLRTQVDTLGLAGCAIGDDTIWAVAKNRGPFIER